MYNNKKLALSIFWVVLGIVLIVLSIKEVLNSSLYAGMGGALAAVGVLQAMRNFKYQKDPEYKEKIDTEITDERNTFLRMKSWSWAGYITVLIEGIGVIAAMAAGQRTIQLTLAYSMCLLIVAYWVAYLILNKRY